MGIAASHTTNLCRGFVPGPHLSSLLRPLPDLQAGTLFSDFPAGGLFGV